MSCWRRLHVTSIRFALSTLKGPQTLALEEQCRQLKISISLSGGLLCWSTEGGAMGGGGGGGGGREGGGGGTKGCLAGFQPMHVASETGAKPEVSLVKQTLHACSSQLIAPLILNDSAS